MYTYMYAYILYIFLDPTLSINMQVLSAPQGTQYNTATLSGHQSFWETSWLNYCIVYGTSFSEILVNKNARLITEMDKCRVDLSV